MASESPNVCAPLSFVPGAHEHYMRDIPSPAPHLLCQSVTLLLCRCEGAKLCCARPFQLFDHFAVTFLVRNSGAPQNAPTERPQVAMQRCMPVCGCIAGKRVSPKTAVRRGKHRVRAESGPFYTCSKRHPWGGSCLGCLSDLLRTSLRTQMKVDYGPS